MAAPTMPPIGTPPLSLRRRGLYYFLALEQCVSDHNSGYPDQQGQRFLRALNIDTGEIVWEVPQTGGRACQDLVREFSLLRGA